MDYPKYIVSNQKEESISMHRVKATFGKLGNNGPQSWKRILNDYSSSAFGTTYDPIIILIHWKRWQ